MYVQQFFPCHNLIDIRWKLGEKTYLFLCGCKKYWNQKWEWAREKDRWIDWKKKYWKKGNCISPWKCATPIYRWISMKPFWQCSDLLNCIYIICFKCIYSICYYKHWLTLIFSPNEMRSYFFSVSVNVELFLSLAFALAVDVLFGMMSIAHSFLTRTMNSSPSYHLECGRLTNHTIDLNNIHNNVHNLCMGALLKMKNKLCTIIFQFSITFRRIHSLNLKNPQRDSFKSIWFRSQPFHSFMK